MYKKGYYKGYTARMDPIDVAGGGAPVRGSGGSLNPYNKFGGNTAGKTSTGEVTRMGRWAQVPNTRTPSSLNADNAGWAAAMRRAAMLAAKELLAAGKYELPDPWSVVENPWAEVWPAGWSIPSGWTQCATPLCAGPVDRGWWNNSGTCASFAVCPTNQAAGLNGTTNLPWGTVHATWRQVIAMQQTGGSTVPGGIPRGTLRAQFVRASSAITTMPTWRASAVVAPLPGALPVVGGKLSRRSRDNRAAAPAPRVTVDGRVADKPSVRPATDVVFPPGRPPVIKVGEHVDEPDRKPTKKVRGVPGAMVAAIKLLHSLTELGDFVDALYEALPPIARCAGKRGLVHDLICVLTHADAFADPDVMAKAIGNLLWNHVEDKVIGALFGSNWRFGGSFRPDNYGGTAWVGGGYGAPTPDTGNAGGLIQWSGSARMSPM